MSTLICCALPALFVALGAGATFAGLVSAVPQLVWLSERKVPLLILGACLLAAAGFLQWRARNRPCPTDPALREACATGRDWSLWVYVFSLVVYLVGAGFAVLPQRL